MFPITEVIFKKSRYLIPLHHLIFLKVWFFYTTRHGYLEGSGYERGHQGVQDRGNTPK